MDGGMYTPSVFCIIATEFCERFSFCGLRTILSLYLRNVLLMPEQLATITYHVFMMFCYAVPLAGALLADGLLGRYRTILYFSIIYLAGNILMCLAATPPVQLPAVAATSIGLLLIAAGTGGIKPCVAAFGGDQFQLPDQEDKLAAFFSLFYFTINLGGLLGMVLTPILRKAVQCFSQDTCYSLGFGVPAGLMVVSLSVFVLGKHWYRMKTPRRREIQQFIKLLTFVLKDRYAHPKTVHRHWLDRARGHFDDTLIADAKVLMTVLIIYLPLPVFWALFDQQGSRWTFQAARMDGNFLGMQIQPDQMQVANPLLALFLIPVFERGLYPRFDSLPSNPLLRMLIGGVAAGGAFIASGVLEMKLESTYPQMPAGGTARIHVVNTLPCTTELVGLGDTLSIQIGQRATITGIPAKPWAEYTVLGFAPMVCGDNMELEVPRADLFLNVTEIQVRALIIGASENSSLQVYATTPLDIAKALSGKPKLRIELVTSSSSLLNITVLITDKKGKDSGNFTLEKLTPGLHISKYMEFQTGEYQYQVTSVYNVAVGDVDANLTKTSDFQTITLEMGAVYSLIIREQNNGDIGFKHMFALTPPSSIHMVWLLPQYLLISIAEVLFAVSGLEFSFTQAPKSMKTITIAAWYLSVATGNLLVICITKANIFASQANEFFLFAFLGFLDMALFWTLARNYRIMDIQADGSSCALIPSRLMPLQK